MVEKMAGFEEDNAFIADDYNDLTELPLDMPTDEQIDAWKLKYGKIYMVEIMDKLYIYRGITRSEVKEISRSSINELLQLQKTYQGAGKNMDQDERLEVLEDSMRDAQVRICVLYPNLEGIDFNDPKNVESMAGVIMSLSEYIDDASGFGRKAVPREL